MIFLCLHTSNANFCNFVSVNRCGQELGWKNLKLGHVVRIRDPILGNKWSDHLSFMGKLTYPTLGVNLFL